MAYYQILATIVVHVAHIVFVISSFPTVHVSKIRWPPDYSPYGEVTEFVRLQFVAYPMSFR